MPYGLFLLQTKIKNAADLLLEMPKV